MKSKRLMLILFTCGLLLEACTVKVQDSEFCADLGALGATCFHLLSSAHRDLSPAQWQKIRFGQLCETADAFANLKAVIETLCQNSAGSCTYEQKQQVDSFFQKLDSAKNKVRK